MPHLICPTCRRRVRYVTMEDVPYRPFCSLRCKRIDLSKWLNEQYRICEPLDVAEDLPGQDRSDPA